MIFRLSDFGAAGDGCTNDAGALRACFAAAAGCPHSMVILEPGVYLVDTRLPIALSSYLTVQADGAVLCFPRELGADPCRQMFCGTDLTHVTWQGGHFTGYVYDPDREENPWPPAAYSGCIRILAGDSGAVSHICLRDISAENIAGAVVCVRGREAAYAEAVDIRDCRFSNCGKFMWDYGYLWQCAVFAHAYPPKKVENALRYLPREHMSPPLRLQNGRLYADYMPPMLPNERDQITFFGDSVPRGTKRGKQYFVRNTGAENGLVLSEEEDGAPLSLDSLPPGTRLFRNMFYVFHDLYVPVGVSSPEKGSIDTVYCRHVTVTGCRIDASGDSMHISHCRNVVFSSNQILGSRMGAFFIAFNCENITVTGNTVHGTNGSRTMSVESSVDGITITGNTFVGGGRGCWLNRPRNAIISDNLFIGNTQKCIPDLQTGRICQVTGDFERYPELYFTGSATGAEYGPVILRGNLFQTDAGASAAVAFNAGGRDILVDGNVFRGQTRQIHVAAGCHMPLFSNNLGMGTVEERSFVNTANQR